MNPVRWVRLTAAAWALRVRIRVLDENIQTHERTAKAYALERDGLEVALAEIHHQQARARV